jgi:hypothetical protein
MLGCSGCCARALTARLKEQSAMQQAAAKELCVVRERYSGMKASIAKLHFNIRPATGSVTRHTLPGNSLNQGQQAVSFSDGATKESTKID